MIYKFLTFLKSIEMNELEILQNYWWFLITVLGAVLVFMLFVQGGQTMLFGKTSGEERQLMVNSLGRKWELTYTVLVVFGGAMFASFPLFYSTSFGGAYWLWMLILLSFVLQAVSYEFRLRKGNLYGTGTYDTFLFFNGLIGCVLLGVAVGTMFFGGDFTVVKKQLLTPQQPFISQWGPEHGFREICNLRNLLLGFTIFFLARTQASLYFINNIRGGKDFSDSMRKNTLWNGLIFVVLFLGFLAVLFLSYGVQQQPDGDMYIRTNLYWHNLWSCWWIPVVLLLGVVLVLYGIGRTVASDSWTKGIWFSGLGTICAVIGLLSLIGYNNTSYLPSLTDTNSSLTLANSSSSEFTLTVMSWVSAAIPVVAVYIAWVWYKMNRKPIDSEGLKNDGHEY